MSHVLALLLEYKRYNQDAVIKIYADDHLVDEMPLTADIISKPIKYPLLPFFKGPIGPNLNYQRLLIIPEKLFLFEISEHYLKKSLRIQVINDNNNYTNGFISYYSWIKIHYMCLLPTCLLDVKNLSKLDKFFTHTNQEKSWPPYAYPKAKKNHSSKYNDFVNDFYCYKKGGSFDVEFVLSKKHKTVHLGDPPIGRSWINAKIFRILYAFKALNTHT